MKNQQSVRIIKQGKCLQLRKKGTLKFEIGTNEKNTRLFIRLVENSSAGGYTRDWVSIDSIEKTARKHDEMHATVFADVFPSQGNSNNAGFLTACLLHLKILQTVPEKTIKYQFNSLGYNSFCSDMQKLARSEISLPDTVSDSKKKASTAKKAVASQSKTPANKKSPSSKKKPVAKKKATAKISPRKNPPKK